jgi:ferritin
MDHNTQIPMRGAVRDATGEQVGREFYAAYLYLSMAGYFEATNLPGFARWMRKQYEEETQHALKLFDSLLDRGERVQLPS